VTDWLPIQQWILSLRNEGIFFFLLHHTSGDAKKQFGTIAHNLVAQTVISLQKIDDEEDTGRIKVIYQKKREFETGMKSFEAINHMNGSWGLNEIENSTYQEVVALYKLNATGLQIAKTLNISPPAVSKHKKRAIEKGDLKINKYGKIENLD
jgi:DNA-directed RNA polymerase specialized sigma subunit